jgi:hypothetical protein
MLHAGIQVAESTESFRKIRQIRRGEAAVANGEHKWLSYAGNGMAAGLAVLFAQVAISALARIPPLYPLAAAASTVLGRSARTKPEGTVLLVGLLVYLLMSLLLGLIYHLPKTSTLLSSLLTVRGRLRPAVSGAVYGLAVWLLFIAIVQPIYPWLSETPFITSFWVMIGCFGVPLGLLAKRTEQNRPVELKIIYSSSFLDPPKSAPPKRALSKPKPPPRPSTKGPRRPSTKSGRLKLLTRATQPEGGDDRQR